MEVQIYKSTSPTRPTLRAVFAKAASWGPARGGQGPEMWAHEADCDLTELDPNWPFSAADALEAIAAQGVFQFSGAGSPLLQEQHRILNEYRLRFAPPIVILNAALEVGTGTLFTHEDRYFIVTADHNFRRDPTDPNSRRIDMSEVVIPSDPRPAGKGAAEFIYLLDHVIHAQTPPVYVDVAVVEFRSPEVVAELKKGWRFLPFSAAEPIRPDDDRFVITGFLVEGAREQGGIVSQAMLNLETDFFYGTPTVKYPAPGADVFFHLQQDMTNVDGKARTVKSLQGLSGGPILAVRPIPESSFWDPSKAVKIVAVQSSEHQAEQWARGVRWEAVLQILRSPEIGFNTPP